jgi:hypothetical protein
MSSDEGFQGGRSDIFQNACPIQLRIGALVPDNNFDSQPNRLNTMWGILRDISRKRIKNIQLIFTITNYNEDQPPQLPWVRVMTELKAILDDIPWIIGVGLYRSKRVTAHVEQVISVISAEGLNLKGGKIEVFRITDNYPSMTP